MQRYSLLRYIFKRIGLMLLTFLIIATICFFLIKLLPLPAIKEQGRDVELILAHREALGYGKPIPVQYLRYWQHVLRLDLGLGEQMYAGQSVAGIISEKLPYTLTVNFYAVLLAIPLGLWGSMLPCGKTNGRITPYPPPSWSSFPFPAMSMPFWCNICCATNGDCFP